MDGVVAASLDAGFHELLEQWPAVVQLAWFVVGWLATVAVGWFLVSPAVSRIVQHRNRRNQTIDDALVRYLRVVFVALGFFVGVGTAGYGHVVGDSALLLAAGTLALGVAAQAVIGSLVSGMVLVLDPEFNVGDYIRWGDREGTVQSITLRVTRVLTPNGELLTVPNENLTSKVITRPYGRSRYRIVDRIGLAYDGDVDAAMALLREVFADRDDVTEAPSPRVYVEEFGPDAVVVRVHYWIVDPSQEDVFAARSGFARDVKRRFDAAGLTLSPASKRELEGRIDVDVGDGQTAD